jgi:hypothetical protein
LAVQTLCLRCFKTVACKRCLMQAVVLEQAFFIETPMSVV